MNEVFEKTRLLGEAILRSDEYKKLKQAEEIAMKNEEAAETMGKYLEYRSQMEKMMAMGDKDWAKVKQLNDEMNECQERMNLIDDIVNLNRSRDEFTNLINQVNNVLRFIVTGEMDQGDGEGCTGSCESCQGCKSVN